MLQWWAGNFLPLLKYVFFKTNSKYFMPCLPCANCIISKVYCCWFSGGKVVFNPKLLIDESEEFQVGLGQYKITGVGMWEWKPLPFDRSSITDSNECSLSSCLLIVGFFLSMIHFTNEPEPGYFSLSFVYYLRSFPANFWIQPYIPPSFPYQQ